MSNIETIGTPNGDIAIGGSCDPRYRKLYDAFAENFRSLNELGAAVALYKDGEKLVDLWGGYMDVDRRRAWTEHSIVSMASVVKGMMALGVHMLADQGKLDYDAPVADYWPEFAQNGKELVTVRQAISHHAAIHFIDAAEPGDYHRWERMVAAVAKQKPEWAPGTRGVYHTTSFIFILGKLIAAATGEMPWDWFRREVTEKLGVEYNLRCTAADIANFGPDIDTAHFVAGARMPQEVIRRFFAGMGDPALTLSPEERRQLPFQATAGNARGVARLFSFCAMNGALDGIRIFSPKTIDLMTQVQWYAPCPVWGTPMRTAMGLLLNDPDFFYIGPNPNAFGTAGAGGSFGFADRENRMSMSYALNRWWPALALGNRARRLVDAAYTAI